MLTNNLVDRNDPRSVLEEAEETTEPNHHEMAFALGRLLAWMLDGKTFSSVGFRAYILAHKIRPDLINGMTLDDISKHMGHGRSSGHKLSKELEMTFRIRGLNDRSQAARLKYRQSWRRANMPATVTSA